jgi:hypothetical protein
MGTPLPDEYRHAVLSNPCEIDLDAIVIVDYPVIARILQEGWLTHIPLMALTVEKCCAASFLDYTRPSEQGKKTQITLDATAEASIPLQDWLDSWPRFCLHIRRHLKAANPQSIADAFVAHFEGIMDHYNFKSLYWLYLEYDIHIRTLWESRLGQFSSGIFYEQTWARMQETVRNNSSSLNSQFQASAMPPASQLPCSSHGSSSRGGALPWWPVLLGAGWCAPLFRKEPPLLCLW